MLAFRRARGESSPPSATTCARSSPVVGTRRLDIKPLQYGSGRMPSAADLKFLHPLQESPLGALNLVQWPVAFVVAAIAAEHARNAVLEHMPVVRARPEQRASPVERAQRINDIVVVDGRCVRWPQQGGCSLDGTRSPCPA